MCRPTLLRSGDGAQGWPRRFKGPVPQSHVAREPVRAEQTPGPHAAEDYRSSVDSPEPFTAARRWSPSVEMPS
jgi:hypothetical protein